MFLFVHKTHQVYFFELPSEGRSKLDILFVQSIPHVLHNNYTNHRTPHTSYIFTINTSPSTSPPSFTSTATSLPHFLTSPSTLPLHIPDNSLDLTTLDLTTPTTFLILLRMFQPHRTITRGCCIPIGIVLCGTLAPCSSCHQQFGHFLKQRLDVDV